MDAYKALTDQTVTIKMNGNSLSEYAVVFYVQGGGSTYKAIVKNGVVLN